MIDITNNEFIPRHVPDQNSETIHTFFNMVSMVGSRVVSDAHGGYNFLGTSGWQHGVVCHRCHFVDQLQGGPPTILRESGGLSNNTSGVFNPFNHSFV